MKPTRNITLTIPTDILRKAKLLAAQKNTSLSVLVSQTLADMVARADAYDQARRRNLALLSNRPDFGTQGGTTWKREALHDRSSGE